MVDHLRISLTNRCNLDCFYCHKEGNRTLEEDDKEEMSAEKVKTVLKTALDAGIKSIKFTGGEPLIRKDIIDIISAAIALGFEDVGLTTNGTLLHRYAQELWQAGLRRVNIGCDSLTGILPKNTERLKENICIAKDAGLDVKLNMVVLKGINDMQMDDMLRFAMDNKVSLQLIELIECDDRDAYEKHFFSLAEKEKELARIADDMQERDMQRRKRYYFGKVFVEVVRPDRRFCEKCNKLRMTASGKLKPCLMKDTGIIDFKGKETIEKVVMERDAYGYD